MMLDDKFPERSRPSGELLEAMSIIEDECFSHMFCNCCPLGNDNAECLVKKYEPYKWKTLRIIVPKEFGGFVPIEEGIEPPDDEEVVNDG